jgi:hypothetical protein
LKVNRFRRGCAACVATTPRQPSGFSVKWPAWKTDGHVAAAAGLDSPSAKAIRCLVRLGDDVNGKAPAPAANYSSASIYVKLVARRPGGRGQE